ncbi:hypothetical protein OUZ56_032267 [Daphnia magna]|uniref:Uncharacterized protein n=1 Tax=Daphnia magna TaxID=35525 RepID=A0ABQ9ZXF0_9CRUS|nr:hypothetical protein OUZ56_032267 [Daphnia magna]
MAIQPLTSGTNLAMAVNTHAGGGDGAFGGEGGIVVGAESGGGEWGLGDDAAPGRLREAKVVLFKSKSNFPNRGF